MSLSRDAREREREGCEDGEAEGEATDTSGR